MPCGHACVASLLFIFMVLLELRGAHLLLQGTHLCFSWRSGLGEGYGNNDPASQRFFKQTVVLICKPPIFLCLGDFALVIGEKTLRSTLMYAIPMFQSVFSAAELSAHISVLTTTCQSTPILEEMEFWMGYSYPTHNETLKQPHTWAAAFQESAILALVLAPVQV